MRLYEICGAIENCFDEETGEITVDLDALELAKEEKVDNIACLYKSIVAKSDAIKNEEQKLRQRRRVLENKADKVAIKKEIKAGKTVKGAELVERVNIVIS